jgi:hypothetical protein
MASSCGARGMVRHMIDPTVAPSDPVGPSPLRRAGSIRRTATLDTSWPEGMGKSTRVHGHARDLYTPADGSTPRVLAEDWLEVSASAQREILYITTKPSRARAAELIGSRGGGHLRAKLAQVLPGERETGSPLYLLIDDFSGASLVAGWAWSRWDEEWTTRSRGQGPTTGRNRLMEGICAGFRPGSTALRSDGTADRRILSSAPVVPLPHPEDPLGWHTLPEQAGVGMRRARRIDVWVEDVIHIDAGFQDSATSPAGGRVAVHEYHVTARADPNSFELISVKAEPRVLPYRECPAASPNASRMLGTPLGELRLEVLEKLPGSLGCTHLNDVLRSFAEVPQMLANARL